jgi:hydroxymethylbilane synthase
MTQTLRIGTRGSQLALWQARTVASRVTESGGPPCELVVIKTSGDRLSEANLSAAGGKRLFVKEIEEALLCGHVDLAVHSSKDMPAVLPEGLVVAGVLPREDPRDAIVLPAAPGDRRDDDAGFAEPPDGESLRRLLGVAPLVGTSSVRRIAQLVQALPGARFAAVRGNVDTRLRKVDEGQFDAIVLAIAGMKRLGVGHRISAALPIELCVPAPGQGIVAIETRTDDESTREHVARVSDAPSLSALMAERGVVEALGGGCQLPIGALARSGAAGLDLIAVVASLDGKEIVRARARGAWQDASALGHQVADELLAFGAGRILGRARTIEAPPAHH